MGAASVGARLAPSARTRVELLLRAYRLANAPITRRAIRARLDPYVEGPKAGAVRQYQIGWARYGSFLADPRVNRSIVLKAPRPSGEKGVLLLMFEYNWLRVLSDPAVARYLDEAFQVVFQTSWSPTDYALLALALNTLPGTIFVQACNYGEIPALEQFSPRVKCLPTIACDWINPSFYRPRPSAERSIDILMVANWAPFKRHWQFLETLSRMPRNLRVTLVGQPEAGRTRDEILAEAALYGVKQQLAFVDSVSISEVTRLQCDSRVSLIFSRREGCCVAAVESLFADSPLGMLRDAHVGPIAYINEQTGVLLDPSGGLDRQLMRFLEISPSLRPRDWAVSHIAFSRSHERVNRMFRDHAKRHGLPWTADLKAYCLRPYAAFVSASDREEMRPVYEDLHRRFPHTFSPHLIQDSKL